MLYNEARRGGALRRVQNPKLVENLRRLRGAEVGNRLIIGGFNKRIAHLASDDEQVLLDGSDSSDLLESGGEETLGNEGGN